MQRLSPTPPSPQAQIYIDEDTPCYRVIEKRGFVDDQDRLWEKGRMIYWEGPPSMGLEPMNDLAEVAMLEHLERLDKLADDVNKLKGTGHASLVNAYEARRRIRELKNRQHGIAADAEEQMPIMQAARLKSKARAVESHSAPPMMRGNKKKTGMDRKDSNAGRALVNEDDKGL